MDRIRRWSRSGLWRFGQRMVLPAVKGNVQSVLRSIRVFSNGQLHAANKSVQWTMQRRAFKLLQVILYFLFFFFFLLLSHSRSNWFSNVFALSSFTVNRFIGKIAGMAVYHGKLLDGMKTQFHIFFKKIYRILTCDLSIFYSIFHSSILQDDVAETNRFTWHGISGYGIL